MDFKKYQDIAKQTDQNPKQNNNQLEKLKSEIIPLLGLVGEAGVLLSEYKKRTRDGDHYNGFKNDLKEELGDLLWYIANIATKFDINLNEVAEENLQKIKERWCKPLQNRILYDKTLPSKQQLPRVFSYRFYHQNDKIVIEDIKSKKEVGDILTDNSYKDDGYRYHDVMHMTFMAYFGWSPVFRKLLRTKEIIENRPDKQDEVEDGGRAQIIEEAIVQATYIYANKNNFLQGNSSTVDWQLLKFIKQMTANLEVKDRTEYEWDEALKSGLKNWCQLKENNGGIIEGNLSKATIRYKKHD